MKIVGIPHYLLDDYWYSAEPFIKLAIEASSARALYDLESIQEFIRSRDMQLWFVVSDDTKVIGAIVTQVLTYPRAKVLDVNFLGGEKLPEWEHLFQSEMLAFAKVNDCSRIRGFGRLGWRKAAKKLGAEPTIYFEVPVEGLVL